MEIATQPAGESQCAITLVSPHSFYTDDSPEFCRVLQHGLRFEKVHSKIVTRYRFVTVLLANFMLLACVFRCSVSIAPSSLGQQPATRIVCREADNPNRMSIMKSGTRRFQSQPGHLVTPFGVYKLDTAHKKGVSSSVRGVSLQITDALQWL